MTRRGVASTVHLVEQTCETGVRLTQRWFDPFERLTLRSLTLPKRYVTIEPNARWAI
jgi:hypothetical protein